jgi:UDP:flavonoid glycosyltransferase YjiC (YdhE family)
MGHLSPHRDLLHAIIQMGHQVHAVVRDVAKTQRAFAGLDIPVWQAPIAFETPEPVYRPTATFAHILHNGGFSRAQTLHARTLAWDQIINVVRPDLVIIDYAPTLLLCLRGRSIPSVILASGFFIPPQIHPLPVFSTLQGRLPLSVPTSDAAVHRVINEVLRLRGQEEVKGIYQLFHEGVTPLLKSFPELDHYPQRQGGLYLGSPPSPGGVEPQWPSATGPHIFCYLKPFSALDQLLSALSRLPYPTLIASDGIGRDVQEKYSSNTLRFSSEPVDLNEATKTCKLAINNANHETTSQFLLKGVPVLLAPLSLEQEIMASNIVKMGAGMLMKTNTAGIERQLKELVEGTNHRAAAAAFAQRQSSLPLEGFGERLLERLRSLVNL